MCQLYLKSPASNRHKDMEECAMSLVGCVYNFTNMLYMELFGICSFPRRATQSRKAGACRYDSANIPRDFSHEQSRSTARKRSVETNAQHAAYSSQTEQRVESETEA
jgi:hypothetical protein